MREVFEGQEEMETEDRSEDWQPESQGHSFGRNLSPVAPSSHRSLPLTGTNMLMFAIHPMLRTLTFSALLIVCA